MPAAGERGQPPDVDADQPGKELGLDVAEHRELCRQVLDGAVPLAQLDAGKSRRQRRLGLDGLRRRHEAVTAQRLRQGLRAGRDVRAGLVNFGCVAAFHLRKTLDGELPDCIRSGHFIQAPECGGCDVQVVVTERGLTLGAEDVAAGGTPGAGSGPVGFLNLDDATARKLVQVAAHGGGRETQQVTKFGGTDRAMFQHRIEDTVAGAFVSIVRLGGTPSRGSRRHRHLRGVGRRPVRGAVRRKPRRRGDTHGIHNTIMS